MKTGEPAGYLATGAGTEGSAEITRMPTVGRLGGDSMASVADFVACSELSTFLLRLLATRLSAALEAIMIFGGAAGG